VKYKFELDTEGMMPQDGQRCVARTATGRRMPEPKIFHI